MITEQFEFKSGSHYIQATCEGEMNEGPQSEHDPMRAEVLVLKVFDDVAGEIILEKDETEILEKTAINMMFSHMETLWEEQKAPNY